MVERRSVAVFADETGLPAVLESLGAIRPACIIVDPRRQGMLDWLQTHGHPAEVLVHPDKHGRAAFEREIADRSPALGVIDSYSRILWLELIGLFPLGVVNVHGGKLPAYRGANVLQWAIINGESDTAVTLHYVDDEGVDEGPIIAAQTVQILHGDTALTLRQKLCSAGQVLLRHWLPQLIEGKAHARAQDPQGARVWPRRRPEDGCIDWSWPDERIRCLTRALVAPWPGAFYFDKTGRKVVVDKALSLDEIAALRKELGK